MTLASGFASGDTRAFGTERLRGEDPDSDI